MYYEAPDSNFETNDSVYKQFCCNFKQLVTCSTWFNMEHFIASLSS